MVFLFYLIDLLVQGIPEGEKFCRTDGSREGHDAQGDGVLIWGEGGLFIGIGILAEAVPLIERNAAFGKVIFGELGF